MLPPGQRYERYVLGLAPEIFKIAGFRSEPLSTHLRKRVLGHTQKHEFDIVAEFPGGELVLVECKDHRELKPKEVVDFYFSVADVTYVQPQRPIHGILVSSSALPCAVTTTLFTTPDLYLEGVRPPLTALKVLELGHGSPTIAYEYKPGSGVSVHVVPPRTHRGIDEMLVDFEAPELETRLSGALGIIWSGVDSLQCHAHVEAATQLLHFGKSDDAIHFAQIAEDKARTDSNRHLYEASVNLRVMAEFQRSASMPSRRRSTMPGSHALSRLRNRSHAFLPEHQSSALSFLGAWVGRYVGRSDAAPVLLEAKQVADEMESTGGAYLAFIADFRSAELAGAGEERTELLHRVSEQLIGLGPRHAKLASTILQRANEGRDTSIEANYAPTEPI